MISFFGELDETTLPRLDELLHARLNSTIRTVALVIADVCGIIRQTAHDRWAKHIPAVLADKDKIRCAAQEGEWPRTRS
jgi:hypothetical protein